MKPWQTEFDDVSEYDIDRAVERGDAKSLHSWFELARDTSGAKDLEDELAQLKEDYEQLESEQTHQEHLDEQVQSCIAALETLQALAAEDLPESHEAAIQTIREDIPLLLYGLTTDRQELQDMQTLGYALAQVAQVYSLQRKKK